MFTYSSPASRNLIRAERAMLKSAEPIMVLSNFGSQKEQPKNSTDTVVFRRFLPIDAGANGAPSVTANDYVIAEAVIPNAKSLTPQDVTVTLQQYGVLMKLTNKVEDLYEDDIPAEMTKKVGEHMGTLSELICFGQVKAGTNVLYSNGTTRAGINTAVNINLLRKAARTLESAHASRVTSRLAAGPNFNTSPVSSAYLVFIHTDLENDYRNLPGFVPVEEYGSYKPAHEREIGKVEQFRIITSPYFKPWVGAGSGTQNGMEWNSSNVNVYPSLVVAEEAWGQVALKGMGSVSPTYLPAKQKTHSNPLGQVGYIGASFWKAAVRLNENWMVRIESGATAL